jgi:nitrate/TMAO reductase-like tetraheme cytochrome c subunit
MKITVYILLIILLVILAQLSLSGKQGNPHGDIKFDCMECHSPESWQYKKDGPVFDHGKTGYPLVGAHQFTDCRSCHENLVFSYIGTNCLDCHTDIHKNELGVNCEDCHTTQSWENRQDILKEHNSTQFPLIGVHAVVECEACHINQQRNEYKNTPIECEYCHQDVYKETLNPNHQLAQFQLDCIACHQTVPTTWKAVNWEHPQSFDLKGAHNNADCVECHKNSYVSTSSECISCHLVDYQSATFPNHIQLGYPEDCTLCHTDQQWEGAVFDHLQNTGFELREAHANLFCQDCHINGQITGLPTDCIGCHQNDFDTVQDPNHIDNQFSTECLECHNETVWTPAEFDHNNTQFPLQGAHIPVDCIDCHTDGYTNTPTDCWACHETDFNNVTDPNHVTNNFDHDCTVCHSVDAWDPAFFDHSNTTFPLTGAHIALDCISCHAAGYSNTPTDCWSCHETDYNGVTDPNHVTNNFDHDCTVCHTTDDWENVTFDHSNTSFPLTGAHVTLDCISCHADGYSNTPTDCWSCHETDFNTVIDPSHITNNFDHDCTTCHSTTGWTPVTFDHANTNFPLTGAHLTVDCIDCHSDGYANTPSDCFFCHETDYNNTTDPNHIAAQFPTDCESCHNTTDWNQTTWDHDNQYFPIYTGRHDEEWNTCDECHVDPNDYTVFECIFCHPHNDRNQVDNDHDEESGYVYASWACYDCHPDGRVPDKIKLKFQKAH